MDLAYLLLPLRGLNNFTKLARELMMRPQKIAGDNYPEGANIFLSNFISLLYYVVFVDHLATSILPHLSASPICLFVSSPLLAWFLSIPPPISPSFRGVPFNFFLLLLPAPYFFCFFPFFLQFLLSTGFFIGGFRA